MAASYWTKGRINAVANQLGVRKDWIDIREEMRVSGGLDGKELWAASWDRFLATRPELRDRVEQIAGGVTHEYSAEERAAWEEKRNAPKAPNPRFKNVSKKESSPGDEPASDVAGKSSTNEMSVSGGDEKGTQIPGVMRQYVDAAEFGGLTANGLDEVRWVAANIAVLDPLPATCPSPVAWGLLFWVRRGTANAEKFWTNIWPKTLPSKSSIGGDGGDAGAESNNVDLDDLLDELTGELEAVDVGK